MTQKLTIKTPARQKPKLRSRVNLKAFTLQLLSESVPTTITSKLALMTTMMMNVAKHIWPTMVQHPLQFSCSISHITATQSSNADIQISRQPVTCTSTTQVRNTTKFQQKSNPSSSNYGQEHPINAIYHLIASAGCHHFSNLYQRKNVINVLIIEK